MQTNKKHIWLNIPDILAIKYPSIPSLATHNNTIFRVIVIIDPITLAIDISLILSNPLAIDEIMPEIELVKNIRKK